MTNKVRVEHQPGKIKIHIVLLGMTLKHIFVGPTLEGQTEVCGWRVEGFQLQKLDVFSVCLHLYFR